MFKKSSQKASAQPTENVSSWNILRREIMKDKVAFISLIIVIVLSSFVGIVSFILDQNLITTINPLQLNRVPSAEFWLGTDHAGRDVFGLLIIGARNSLLIGILVTVISGATGILFGIISGYFGSHIDNGIMRIVDFVSILPTLMIIITFVTIFPDYTIIHFALIMSAFIWVGMTRIIRSKTLQERNFEYVQASKTLGTSHFKTIFIQVFPNLSSIIITMMTLSLAANIGIESGLSFLGFGLPPEIPSLGTLVATSRNPIVLEQRWWIWLPASLLILTLMLCINNVGQALRRATDTRQRRG